MTEETNADLRPLVVINEALAIPEEELTFRFSRASGPGGQHVQRTDTRVELLFDVANSPSLNAFQRARILERLKGNIDGEGVLRIVSAVTRSQLDNRADAVRRFQMLVAAALRIQRRRVPTRPSAAAREQRLTEKKAHARRKDARRKVGPGDE